MFTVVAYRMEAFTGAQRRITEWGSCSKLQWTAAPKACKLAKAKCWDSACGDKQMFSAFLLYSKSFFTCWLYYCSSNNPIVTFSFERFIIVTIRFQLASGASQKSILVIIVLAVEGFTCRACCVSLFRYYPFHLSFVSHATDFERHTYDSAGIKLLRSYHTVTVG